MSIPFRDDPGQTAKLDQGRAEANVLLKRASQFVLIVEDTDGKAAIAAACDGEFMLACAQVTADAFIEKYLLGGAE